jgi:hypothetical protein
MKILRKMPDFRSKARGYYIRIFQWPNGSYSLLTRKPFKNTQFLDGMLIGQYFDIESAIMAYRKWKKKYCKKLPYLNRKRNCL